MTQDVDRGTTNSQPIAEGAARLHALSVQLAEARRDVVRSRTVTRLLRDAYRLDDLDSSNDAMPDRFLMLVVENMFCDCAALLRADPPGGPVYHVVGVVGAAPGAAGGTLYLESTPPFFFSPSDSCPAPVIDALTNLLGAQRLLWVRDAATGHTLVLGERRNATIKHQFSINDQETVAGALAVYIDVLDRRRTRRLLEQARQEAEARESERNGVVAAVVGKMAAVLGELADELTAAESDPRERALADHPRVRLMMAVLAEGHKILEAAREILDEQPSPIALELEWISLSDLLLSVVRLAQPSCLQRDIDLRLKPSSGRFRACVDRIWIEMTLSALLAEALTCVDNGAEVAVEARRRADSSVGILITGRNRSRRWDGTRGTAPAAVVFSQPAASVRRLVGAHGAVLTSERPDAVTSRFALSLPGRDCRDE